MSQLYTVRMVSKKTITTYSQDGTVLKTREELIPQVYTDLPLITAQRYKERFPDAQVDIVPQHGAVHDRKDRVEVAGDRRDPGKRYNSTPAAPAPAKPDARLVAAQTGDMTAAINAAVR